MDNRTKKTNNKRFVRYPEGAEMYSMSLSKFQQLAKAVSYTHLDVYKRQVLQSERQCFKPLATYHKIE